MFTEQLFKLFFLSALVVRDFLTSPTTTLLGFPGRSVVLSLALELDFAFFIIIFLPFFSLIPSVVYSDDAIKDSCPSKIVNGKICASLIFILQEGKAFALAGLLVSLQLYPGWLAILRKNRDDITLSQVERESSNEYVGCVSVVCVPRSRWWPRSKLSACILKQLMAYSHDIL